MRQSDEWDRGGCDIIPSWAVARAVALAFEQLQREQQATEIAQRLCETREQIDHTGG